MSNSLPILLPLPPPMAASGFPAALLLSSPGERGCTLRGSNGPVDDDDDVDEEDARRADRAAQQQQAEEGASMGIGKALEERRSKTLAATAAGSIVRARCDDAERTPLLLLVLGFALAAAAAAAREVEAQGRGMAAFFFFPSFPPSGQG